MFGKKKHDKFEAISEKLKRARIATETSDWKRTTEVVVGGLVALGFYESKDSPKVDKLLAIGSQGQTVIDCLSGQIVYRNRAQDGYDQETLSAWDLSGGTPESIRMSGIDGGGLKLCTKDGWSVEAIPIAWPIYHYILQHPGSSIYTDQSIGRESKFELLEFDYKQMAFGFSNSGNSLLLTSSSDITVWTRANPI
ncbi:MAG: hypothetical protein VX083_02000 [Pseudomonadota bacterium]|jgi:hypothetical protein|nr:hypothetical protein [Pseudomonadota bacterium]|tara:strand:+ start:578 stop:1162 length:585 start_codon:yes stop_codon:yes gene_type:complete